MIKAGKGEEGREGEEIRENEANEDIRNDRMILQTYLFLPLWLRLVEIGLIIRGIMLLCRLILGCKYEIWMGGTKGGGVVRAAECVQGFSCLKYFLIGVTPLRRTWSLIF